MSKAKKPKRMTSSEKKLRAEVRAELREKGILPPVKKPLNRKRFCKEAEEILLSVDWFDNAPYLIWALVEMINHTGGTGISRSLEAVGAAKVIKLAKARKDFEAARRDKGEPNTYTIDKLYEATKDILMA